MPTASTLPIIDFSKCGLLVEDEDIDKENLKEAGDRIYQAFSTAGFAYLSKIGIKREQVDELLDTHDNFYKLPDETKRKYYNAKAVNFCYDAFNTSKENPEREFDYHEAFRVAGPAMVSKDTPWPDVPLFKEKFLEMAHTGKLLAHRIFRALGIGMRLQDPEYFCKNHSMMNGEGNATHIRTIRYPPILSDNALLPNQIRIGEHSDFGSITLLFQDDVGGLQVQTPDGYVDATPIEDTVVVNIGDELQLWSGGRLKSTKHRVVPPTDPAKKLRVRRSLAYFGVADDNTLLSPLQFQDDNESVDPESEKKAMRSVDYVTKRFSELFY